LRFRRPVKTQIATQAIKIAAQEGMQVERNAAEAISESCGGDIRQVVNCLQMWASDNKGKSTMTYKGVKERESSINKDEMLRVSLFDAAKLILEGRKGLGTASSADDERAHFFKRSDAFFVDYSFTGLIVQQNYLKIMNSQHNEVKRSNDEDKMVDFLERMHDAASSMSDYALVEHGMRGGSDMNWSLLPFSGVLTVKTGFHAGGPTGGFFPGFPEFTTWLGRNSSKGKKHRIIQELNHHMNYKISGGSQEVRLSYLPFLRQRFLTQLRDSEDEDCNAVAIRLMDDYGLDRDDIFENLDEFRMDQKSPKFADIDSKRKAAFTREYNQGSHKSQALVEEQGAPKKSKRGGGGKSDDTEDPDAINDDDNLGDDEEEEDEDLEKIKAAFAKKGRKSSAKANGGKGAGKAGGKGNGRKKK
jgi:replication factor C subunit 1